MSEKLRVTKQPGFLPLWIGQTISAVGSQVSGIAMPVIAVTLLNATELQMGFLNAANTSAFLVFGLLAGALVDRWIKRKVMIAADLIRMIAIGLIPILWYLELLNVYQLIVIGAVMSIASVFFDVSYQSYIPILLPREYIGIGNSRMEVTSQISGIASPGLVGALLKIVKAPVLLIFDAISFLVSAISLMLIKDREQPKPKADRRPIQKEIAEGLSFVWNQKLIRAISFTTSTSNLFTTISGTLFTIYFFREQYLGFDTAAFGIMMMLGSIGGLLGAASTPKLIKVFGEGPLVVISAIGLGLVQLLVPLSWVIAREVALVPLVANSFLTAFLVLTYNITQVTARQRLCPEHLLGRMNASIRFMVWGCMPIGALISGVLGTAIGVIPTIMVGAVGALLSASFVLFSPLRKMREMPQSPELR
ncbi:MAG: MFS transporter [Acidobacteria bacterium]|nr:MFS transporter [Acidobacteriota bacterium]